VRGGLDRDAFSGINLGRNHRAIDAGSVIVTGSAERAGSPALALHVAAAAPDGAAVPVRLPAAAGQTPVDFLERVDRYVQAEPDLRLRMALGETPRRTPSAWPTSSASWRCSPSTPGTGAAARSSAR